MRRAVLIVAFAALLSCVVPSICRAQDVGDYASGAAPKVWDWTVPPGHYGLLASYADAFLSNAPANGNYVISWTALTDATDEADKADQLADFFVVDVRGKTAFDAGHLAGAINIPYASLAQPSNLASLPTDQAILVVCGSGLTSSQAAAVLGMLGYNVRVLMGGMAVVPAGYLVH